MARLDALLCAVRSKIRRGVLLLLALASLAAFTVGGESQSSAAARRPTALGLIALELDQFSDCCVLIGSSIWTVRTDGSMLHRFPLSSPDSFPASPVLSPDGRRIAYEEGSDVYVMNADGSDKRRLTSATKKCNDDNAMPRWSPDGKRIVYVCFHNGPQGYMNFLRI